MTESLRFKIHRFKQIDSTNSALLRSAEEGAPVGSVFVADYQTRGRGKWGRNWISPRGKNLLFSLLLRPSLKASKAPFLTQVVCRSVAKVLQKEYGLTPAFKRPNDVLVKGRKICGVLIEARGRANGTLENLVIGVGVNVNALSEELVEGATSVREETGEKVSRGVLLKALLAQLKKDLSCYF